MLHTNTQIARLAVAVPCSIGELITTKTLVDGPQKVTEGGTNEVAGRSTTFEDGNTVLENTASVFLTQPCCFRRIHFDPLSIIHHYETDCRGSVE